MKFGISSVPPLPQAVEAAQTVNSVQYKYSHRQKAWGIYPAVTKSVLKDAVS